MGKKIAIEDVQEAIEEVQEENGLEVIRDILDQRKELNNIREHYEFLWDDLLAQLCDLVPTDDPEGFENKVECLMARFLPQMHLVAEDLKFARDRIVDEVTDLEEDLLS